MSTLHGKKQLFLVNSLMLFTLAFGLIFSPSLRYVRSSALNGEYWRLITCHFTHTGLEHLLLNLVGFILITILFSEVYSLRTWALGTLTCCISIGLSFILLLPTLDWYMGFSGVLHGLLLMGIIGKTRQGNLWYLFLLLIVICKLLYEQLGGPTDITSNLIGVLIVTESHLAGAITGGIFACLIFCFEMIKSPYQPKWVSEKSRS